MRVAILLTRCGISGQNVSPAQEGSGWIWEEASEVARQVAHCTAVAAQAEFKLIGGRRLVGDCSGIESPAGGPSQLREIGALTEPGIGL